jgi:hypothetical protein
VGCSSVAVCAPDFTFFDLGLDCFEAVSSIGHPRYFQPFRAPHVVELQNDWISFTAVYAGVHQKVVIEPGSGVQAALLGSAL